MKELNIYLSYLGNAKEAMDLYASILNGTVTETYQYKNTPMAEGLTEEEQEKYIHISLDLGKGRILMASDVVGDRVKDFSRGNDTAISIQTESEEETDTLLKALSEGGTVLMAADNSFWGAYFGMCLDKYGVMWMFNYSKEMPNAFPNDSTSS